MDQLNRQMHGDRLDQWQSSEMTIPQVKTLLFLEQAGPERMGGISRHLGTALSATTGIVDRLVERGMVDRHSDPADRRAVVCSLTTQGREAARDFWRIAPERIGPVLESLSPEQLSMAVQGLEAILQAAEALQRGADAEREAG